MTIKEITKDLKPSKRKFVIQYVFDAETAGNATKSFLAVRPTFNPESARREASLWLHEPEVQQAVKKLEQMKLDDEDANAIKKIKETIRVLLETSILDLHDENGFGLPKEELGIRAMLINGVYPLADGHVKYSIMPREKVLDMAMKRYGLYEPEERKIEVNLPVVEVVPKSASVEEWNKQNE